MQNISSKLKTFFVALIATLKALFTRSEEETPVATLSVTPVTEAKFETAYHDVWSCPENYGPASPLPKYFCYLLKERGIDLNTTGGTVKVRFLRWLYRTNFIFNWTNKWFIEIENRYAQAVKGLWYANKDLSHDWRVELQMELNWAPLLSKDWISPVKAVRIMKRIAQAIPSQDAIYQKEKETHKELQQEWFQEIRETASSTSTTLLVFENRFMEPYEETQKWFEDRVSKVLEGSVYQYFTPVRVALHVENLENFLQCQLDQPWLRRMTYKVTYITE